MNCKKMVSFFIVLILLFLLLDFLFQNFLFLFVHIWIFCNITQEQATGLGLRATEKLQVRSGENNKHIHTQKNTKHDMTSVSGYAIWVSVLFSLHTEMKESRRGGDIIITMSEAPVHKVMLFSFHFPHHRMSIKIANAITQQTLNQEALYSRPCRLLKNHGTLVILLHNFCASSGSSIPRRLFPVSCFEKNLVAKSTVDKKHWHYLINDWKKAENNLQKLTFLWFEASNCPLWKLRQV